MSTITETNENVEIKIEDKPEIKKNSSFRNKLLIGCLLGFTVFLYMNPGVYYSIVNVFDGAASVVAPMEGIAKVTIGLDNSITASYEGRGLEVKQQKTGVAFITKYNPEKVVISYEHGFFVMPATDSQKEFGETFKKMISTSGRVIE